MPINSPRYQLDTHYQEWKKELIQISAKYADMKPDEIRINDIEAFKWYESGISPQMTFRETWDNEQDSEL